ncbi:hypothetical protein TNCV_1854391 [Trichonephila clavipes]|nr:hypothetical protein TNCV_1854391 [Trichonephila clavipes]
MTQKCEEWKKVWRAQQLVINEDPGHRVAKRALYIARCAEQLFCTLLTIVPSVTDESSPLSQKNEFCGAYTPATFKQGSLVASMTLRNGNCKIGDEDNEWEL